MTYRDVYHKGKKLKREEMNFNKVTLSRDLKEIAYAFVKFHLVMFSCEAFDYNKVFFVSLFKQ